MLRSEEMQVARKETRDLESSITVALNEYFRLDKEFYGDIEQGKGDFGKLHRIEGEITTLLDKLSNHIYRMENMGGGNNQSWKASISAIKDFYRDSQLQFNKTRNLIRERQQKAELLQAAKQQADLDTEVDPHQRLYEKEADKIHSSMKMIDESLAVGMGIRESLQNQGQRISRVTTRLVTIAEGIPGINQVINAAGRKKTKDNLIVATAIATAVCFTFWWVL